MKKGKVIIIGGNKRAGKTTLTMLLHNKYNFNYYNYDMLLDSLEESFKELQEAIARVNKLTGQNYKIEQRLSPIIGSNGQPTLHPITGQPLMAKGIYVQPIGFFKYKNGNKIRTKLIKH